MPSALSASGDNSRHAAIQIRREMGAEVARVGAGAVDQGGLPAAQELRAHQLEARRIDHPAVMAHRAFAVEDRHVKP